MVIDGLPLSEEVRIYVPDYFNEPALSPKNSFAQWAENFNQWAQEQGSSEDANILVGYSLGGRLALHALEQNSALWRQVILISTNPGFDDGQQNLSLGSEERRQRSAGDTLWADEFLQSSWDLVLQKWNSQAVFARGGKEPLRSENEYSRELLSLALTQWSLSQQKNMRPVIQKNIEKVCWMVGEWDNKYVQLSQHLAFQIPGLVVDQIPASSHRVLFDCPEVLGGRLAEVIRQLS